MEEVGVMDWLNKHRSLIWENGLCVPSEAQSKR